MARVRTPVRSGQLIRGNFLPSRTLSVLQVFLKVLGVFLGVAVLTSMVIYGLTVHVEADINGTGQKTRIISEMNKELQVSLNRLQSYQNVEHAAEQVPNLHLSEEILEVSGKPCLKLPLPPSRQGAWPRVQGY